MNCNECSILLDDYIEDELDTKNLEFLETHLASCANCARSCRELKAELNLYDHYLSNIEATPQLWTGLQERLEKAKSPSYRQSFVYLRSLFVNRQFVQSFKPLQAAALIIILMAGIAGFIKYKFFGSPAEQNYATLTGNAANVNQTTQSEIFKPGYNADSNLNDGQIFIGRKISSAASARTQRPKNILRIGTSGWRNPVTVSKTVNTAMKEPSDEVVRKAESQYVTAIAVLTRDIKQRRRGELSSKNLLQIETTALTELDRTIENTRREVREQPQNPVAVQYMTDAYAKKVELLRNILGK
jgi:hypothetical protein